MLLLAWATSDTHRTILLGGLDHWWFKVPGSETCELQPCCEYINTVYSVCLNLNTLSKQCPLWVLDDKMHLHMGVDKLLQKGAGYKGKLSSA